MDANTDFPQSVEPIPPSLPPSVPTEELRTERTARTAMPALPPRATQRRLARFWSALFGALALFASGVGIGWLVTADVPIDLTPTAIDVAGQPTTTQASEAPAAPARDLADGTEPVADIAEAVLPSVVQIEVGTTGFGTGVIYDSAGKILTAAHVVEGVSSVNIRLSDGSRLEGRVLGSDTSNDVAVIEVDRSGLPAIPLALDEEVRVGQLAVAVGSPWGLESTVTSGVVSAVNRSIAGTDGFQNMIQTDASINPGNSGGALVDRFGRLIGINVSIYSATGANDGVGFAVPIDRAYRVAEALESGSDFVAGFLGVRGGDAGVGERAGAVVSDVTTGSAAAKAGILPGDKVVSFDGRSVTGIADLAGQVRSYQAGDTVTVGVLRDGQEMEIPITLGSG